MKRERFGYGTVLKVQREQTTADIRQAMLKMKQLGMNTVVIWPAVYWWEDRTYPNYPYQTGHEILRYAEEIGLQIIMELAGQITSLEYAPDFVMKPEYYCVDQNGNRFHTDIRPFDYINYNHPEVKQLIAKNFREAAAQYRSYSSLYGYDIWNETMFTSYDAYTLQLFREWLQCKYGTIARLNEVWDRCYYDWSQVQFTYWLWASVMPMVDYNQFKKDNIGIILREWSEIVKEVDPNRPVIADNIGSGVLNDGLYDRPQDDWNVARNVDEYGISLYPKNVPPGMKDYERWETLAATRASSRAGRFWISELQSHHQALFNPASLVYPHEVKWWNWESIMNGAKGIIYWKWFPFLKGVQTYGRGLVDQKGDYTIRAEYARDIARVIGENERAFVEYEVEQPKAAILYDTLNHDFSKAYTRNYQSYLSTSIYTDSIAGLYEALWHNQVPADFMTRADIVAGAGKRYKVIFLTNQLNIDHSLAAALREYVAAGGILICDGKCGEVNDLGYLNTDLPGGPMHDALGCSHVDVDVQALDIHLEWEGCGLTQLAGFYEKRLVRVDREDVKILGRFKPDEPAILLSQIGQGAVITIATMLWYGYRMQHDPTVQQFVGFLGDTYGLRSHSSDQEQVKVAALKGDDGLIVCAFHYGEQAVDAVITVQWEDQEGTCQLDELYTGTMQVVSVQAAQLQIPVRFEGRDVAVWKLSHIEGSLTHATGC